MDNKSYAWNPEEYANHSSAQYKWALELINKLGLKGNEAVLDIGCGDGKITALISSYLNEGNITGIDNSAEMIDFAQNNFPSPQYANLSFVLSDATRLNFDSQFDVAFSNAALHWVRDHTALLRGVKKSLKKSGRILFQMGGTGNVSSVSAIIDELIQDMKWRKYFGDFSFPYTFCSPGEYRQWLDDAGLIPQRVELIPKDMTQKGRKDFAGWMRTTWMPYTERIPENKRDDFIDDIINLYSERFPADNDGLFHIKVVRLEVEAVNP